MEAHENHGGGGAWEAGSENVASDPARPASTRDTVGGRSWHVGTWALAS